MSIEAAVVQYRKEMVAQIEVGTSLLRSATTREMVVQGNQAIFLVAGSRGDTAVTRGTNGDIPYGNPQNAQVTCDLTEKHAPYAITGFNFFASQGDQRRLIQQGAVKVINRDIDLTVLSALSAATQTTGSAATGSLDLVMKSLAILGNTQVDIENANDMFCIASPAFKAYLMQTPEFSNAQYVDVKPFAGRAVKMLRWAGVNWIFSPLVTGVGTSSEYCYMFHRDAIGYAMNTGEERILAGYNQEQDRYYANAIVYHGAKVLQNAGIVKIVHDGSAYVAS